MLSWGNSLLLLSSTFCCSAASGDGGVASEGDTISEDEEAKLAFTVLPVAGDGRCMFRSIVLGIWHLSGEEEGRPAKATEVRLAWTWTE